MAFYDPLVEKLSALRRLSPTHWRALRNRQLTSIVARELTRSRARIDQLHKRYPSAEVRELAQRLIDGKKGLAGMMGGVSGVFGVLSVPADLLVMVWLELVLLCDLATLYKVNVKSERARAELLDLYGYLSGIGPLTRSGPRLLGSAAALLLTKSGLKTVGRAVPVVAAPLSAYLNSEHLQRVGEEAVRHYEGFSKVHHKNRVASG